MTIYRRRAPSFEARKWTGLNVPEMRLWLEDCFDGVMDENRLRIHNHDGRVIAFPGDMIVKDDHAFYPMHAQEFAAEFEEASVT